MIEIPLTKGHTALIDDDSYDLVKNYSWYVMPSGSRKTNYAVSAMVVGGVKKQLRMHRLIMGLGFGDARIVDHVNGCGTDNRKSNLRIATLSENQHNQRLAGHNKSGFKGVSFWKESNQWRADIKLGGKTKYLGAFTTAEAAAREYDSAARKLFGIFAKLNFPD